MPRWGFNQLPIMRYVRVCALTTLGIQREKLTKKTDDHSNERLLLIIPEAIRAAGVGDVFELQQQCREL